MTTNADLDRALWRWLLIVGLLTIAIGAWLAFWPASAIVAFGWLVAIQFIITGVAYLLGRSLTGDNIGQVLLGVLLGALGIFVGLVAFRNPTAVVVVLTFLIGAGWFISGVVEAVDAAFDRGGRARGWRVISGLISAVAGLVLLFYPVTSSVTLAVFTGIVMLVIGVARVIAAFRMKQQLGV